MKGCRFIYKIQGKSEIKRPKIDKGERKQSLKILGEATVPSISDFGAYVTFNFLEYSS